MSDGGSIQFDRSFILPHENGSVKGSPLDRRFINLQELQLHDDVIDNALSPKQKVTKELFPHLEGSSELPRKTDEVEFDRPFFAMQQETLPTPLLTARPALPLPEPEPMELSKAPSTSTKWQFAKPSLEEASRKTPIIETHHTEEHSELTGMFKGTVNMLGSIWAKVVDDIYQTRSSGHEYTNDALNAHVRKRNHINESFYENVDKVHENAKKEETWSFLYNIVEFLVISTGIVGGVGMVAAGANTGNWACTKYGLEMMAGSALSMGSFAMKQMGYDSQYVGALALSGALLTGWGIKHGFSIFANDFAKNLATINQSAMQLSRTLTSHMQMGTQQTRHMLEGSSNELSIERMKNRDDIQKAIGSFKMEDLVELSKAASEQMRMKGEVISRILLGSKS